MKNSQITVRNVDPILKRRIDKLAKMKSTSINELVLQTLRAKVGMSQPDKKINWSKYQGILKDADLDDSVFKDFEKIDESMWQ